MEPVTTVTELENDIGPTKAWLYPTVVVKAFVKIDGLAIPWVLKTTPSTSKDPVISAEPVYGKVEGKLVNCEPSPWNEPEKLPENSEAIIGPDDVIDPDTIKPFLTTNSFAILGSVFHCPNRLLSINI